MRQVVPFGHLLDPAGGEKVGMDILSLGPKLNSGRP